MSEQFTQVALQAALDERPFRFFRRVSSTQNIAREWAMSNPDINGAVVITEEQTEGRGRQGRVWHSPPGSSVMCSVVLRPDVAAEALPRVTLAGGLAVVDAFPTDLQHDTALKWPNDVFIRGRKVSGVLAEAVWSGDQLQAVIMGIGINVRVDFSGTGLEGIAANLETEWGQPVDRAALLATTLDRVDYWVAQLDDPALMDSYRAKLGTLGKRVQVYVNISSDDNTETFRGRAEALDDDGALLVRLDSGELRRVVAADVGLAEE
ncbi:MAG: biotin--[acetyl-CoA-carboxylase] ligase [Chloroflexi bacterium]|nr:biotin--[acetyl-CoA-carboxylase] ligase [Chloroflexota bacterium]